MIFFDGMHQGTPTTFAQGHIGDPTLVGSFDWRKVDCVQADGDELEKIKLFFPNFPHSDKAKVMRYVGDFARMIAANW